MVQVDTFSRDMVIEKAHKALQLLLENDVALLDVNINENSISHKIAEYLAPLFDEWHVDCEYNRDGHEPKKVKLPYHRRFNPHHQPTSLTVPDIVVHRRTTTINLLVIEVKKSSNPDKESFEFDKIKLDCYMKYLDYKFGLFIVVNTDSKLGQPYIIEAV